MKARMVLGLLALCLVLGTLPATADTLYSNGPINGTENAWLINNNFSVTDSFTLTNNSTVTGAENVGLWLVLGDTPLTVDWAITSKPFGGTTYGSGTANLSATPVSVAFQTYQIYSVAFSFTGIDLSAGNYWLQLGEATSPNTNLGYPVYWDQNDGPSTAFQSGDDDPIPSESFDIVGRSSTPAVPEPASLVMLGSGLLGLGGVIRKRLGL